jgi:6-phosphogluconolactonase
MYTLRPDGSLQPGERVAAAGKVVMPMTVSPDKRFLVAAIRSKPFSAQTYSIDRATGALKSIGTGPLAESFPYVSFDRSGRFLPNGKFLYAAERTSSSIGAFSVDAASGKLTFLGSTPTEKQPHGFAIDPSGKFMVVAGEKSDTISVYSIDQASGALKLLNKYPTGKGSNWVEIVSFD